MPHSASNPLVSVIMPAFNHEAYVRAAVESVLNQTYTHLELIVIDDASSDGTWGVLETFDDERIRCYRHDENQGAHATLNEGLCLAKGQIFSILNSDDVYYPGRLSSVISVFLAEQDVQAVVTQYDFLDESGTVTKDAASLAKAFPDAVKGLGEAATQVSLLELQTLSLLARNYFHTTSNLVMRRGAFDKVGPFRAYRYVHDHDFFLRLCLRFPVRMLNESHLGYRVHTANTLSECAAATVAETAAMLAEYMLTHEIQCLRRQHPVYMAVLRYLLVEFRGYGADRLMLFLVFGEVAGSVSYRGLEPLFDGQNTTSIRGGLAELLRQDRAVQDLQWQSEQTTYWWGIAQELTKQSNEAIAEKDKLGHALWEANNAKWRLEQDIAFKQQELSAKDQELSAKDQEAIQLRQDNDKVAQELWNLKQEHWADRGQLWQAEQERNYLSQQVAWLQGHSHALESALTDLHARHERVISVRVMRFLRRVYAYVKQYI